MMDADVKAMQQHVMKMFVQRYGTEPDFVVRAPGRVNLIGEHTDYNDGFVLPMAIDHSIWIALRPRSDRRVAVHSLDYEEDGSFDLDDMRRGEAGWLEYIKGTAWALRQEGHRLHGWEGMLVGDVPRGAGLSSSAALEMAAARAFAALGSLSWSPEEMACIGQAAENKWVGVQCGIMDQMISAAGQAGHALLIDCRSLKTKPVPLPKGTAVVIMDTATRRGLVDSAYNERRRQCEAAASFFGVAALRDVDLNRFVTQAHGLDADTRERAWHVVTENVRTLQAVEAMQRGDAHVLGQLMDASHASLRDHFEVSSEALNLIVDLARSQEGCYGARMTGAGFGGCAVALVQADQAPALTQHVREAYTNHTGLTPSLYISPAGSGAEVVRPAGL